MEKVLVPTDFSANAKAGVRFAIRWADQQKLELVFVHVLNILRASRWSDAYFARYAEQEEKTCLAKLEQSINGIYKELKIVPGPRSFQVIQGVSADLSILDHCRKNPGYAFVCISTRGAGKFKRIFGTNTGNLITRSAVPVLAVPPNHRGFSLNRIMYATDLMDYDNELKKVAAVAQSFKASVDVVHFSWPDELTIDKSSIEAASKKQLKGKVKLHFEEDNGMRTFVQNLENQVSRIRPGLVVMFTNQKRTFFQRLLAGSRTEQVSFRIKTPLLVFNKG